MKTFTSSKGVTLELKPVSQFKLDTLRTSKVDLPRPTYEVAIVGGGTQSVPMDAISAKNKDRLPEWEKYLAAQAEIDTEYSKKFTMLLVWEGVEITVPDSESEWQKTNDFFGIKIPDNAIERKWAYVRDEVLATPEDVTSLIADIMEVSSFDEEAVNNLRNSFRPGKKRNAARPASNGKKPVESESDVHSPGSNPLLEPLTK